VLPTGSLLLIGANGGGRRPPAGPVVSAVTAAMPALARSLALDLATIRVNVITLGCRHAALPPFLETP
jgi:NAD(P)-dependent dehydrogenase (short-subunit alcohol dehydrogenase family)